MNIKELYTKFQEHNIHSGRYYLHGQFGSTDDNEKPAMTIIAGKFTVEYEVYYRERGEKHSSIIFTEESKACNYFFELVYDELLLEKIQGIDGLAGMTVNERLFESGLLDGFDELIMNNKPRAHKILRWLRVDEPSIKLILE